MKHQPHRPVPYATSYKQNLHKNEGDATSQACDIRSVISDTQSKKIGGPLSVCSPKEDLLSTIDKEEGQNIQAKENEAIKEAPNKEDEEAEDENLEHLDEINPLSTRVDRTEEDYVSR